MLKTDLVFGFGLHSDSPFMGGFGFGLVDGIRMISLVNQDPQDVVCDINRTAGNSEVFTVAISVTGITPDNDSPVGRDADEWHMVSQHADLTVQSRQNNFIDFVVKFGAGQSNELET
jgi:hypothetical protein